MSSRYISRSHIQQEFWRISKNKYLLERSFWKKLSIKPLTTLYIACWTKLVLLARKISRKNLIAKRKTFWGENIIMIIPHPRLLYFFGCLGREELSLTYFFINNLRTGDVFIDGGSNIGYYSLLASNLVGETGTVHSFEPTPKVIPVLKQNLQNKENVCINAQALWDKESRRSMFSFPTKHSVFNTLIDITHLLQKEVPGLETDLVTKELVDTVDLDTYCRKHNIKPTHIKLDIERAEYYALLGAKETIKACKPIISLEIWGESAANEEFKNILNLLTHLNYQIFTFAHDFSLSPVSEKEKLTGNNILCFPKPYSKPV